MPVMAMTPQQISARLTASSGAAPGIAPGEPTTARSPVAGRNPCPPPLERLLSATGEQQDAVWASFLAEYSALLIHAAKSVSRDSDEAMDGYAEIVERLRANDYQRLRGYAQDPRSKFTTWLVVVARRICVDVYRARFGRNRPSRGNAPELRRQTRRRLEDLVAGDAELAAIPDASMEHPDQALMQSELRVAVSAAMERLSESDRLLLRLRFDDGLRAPEIARLMRFPSQFHVYRRVTALLATLREALARQGLDRSSG
jgi:RNA polymerase sigma factor (sigma-70 family)